MTTSLAGPAPARHRAACTVPTPGRGPLVLSLALLWLAGCSLTASHPPAASPRPSPAATDSASAVSEYLRVLETMSDGTPDVQTATLAAARETWQQRATVHDGLVYAIALGAPGHAESNPIEASRLLTTLLARVQPDALAGDVRRLAEALRQEFAARTALYAEIARQKEAAARELRESTLLSEARIEDLNAELVRLKRDRDEARRKLQAITDMERQLIEKEPGPDRPEGNQ